MLLRFSSADNCIHAEVKGETEEASCHQGSTQEVNTDHLEDEQDNCLQETVKA